MTNQEKIAKSAESLGAVHTHTHTHVVLKDKKIGAIFASQNNARKTNYVEYT